MTPKETLTKLQSKLDTISKDRKPVLDSLVDFIVSQINETEKVTLNFICTHNSRRSHLGQVWMQTAADFVGLKNVITCSAGTEATAVHANTINTFKHHGFNISTQDVGENPKYTLTYNESGDSLLLFSKVLEDEFNPQSDFGAVMTCSQASEACPMVFGALGRFPLNFEDPKEFDNDESPLDGYIKRSEEIALEILYVAEKAKSLVG